MLRNIGAIVAGLVAWIVIVSVMDRLMRLAWPDYAAVVPTMAFTLPMMFARLSEAAITTFAAGAINRLIARTPLWPATVQGVIILLVFLPEHYKLWHNFPVWYHLTFLGFLVPLTVLGAALVPRRSATASA
ncbi:MAG TPA: hypothetical protein VHT03_13525 [Rhizomicrobium sp.]|jgi:hypothetical protein|nr:hypothetical protein [Rhizomicrobium sp.]